MSLQPYWQSSDGRALVYHCKAEELIATLPDDAIDLTITDPPYTKKTHKGARSNKKRKNSDALIDFDSISFDDLRALFAHVARVTKRWVVATTDYQHAFPLEQNPPQGLDFIRLGVWVKPNGAPQKSGDRPAMGWESIVFMHRTKRKRVWKGGGRSSVFVAAVNQRKAYASQKPLPLIRDFVELFSEPRDTILDPCMGGGTTLVAGYERGRCVIGCDVKIEAVEHTVNRLREIEKRGEMLLGAERMSRAQAAKMQVALFED